MFTMSEGNSYFCNMCKGRHFNFDTHDKQDLVDLLIANILQTNYAEQVKIKLEEALKNVEGSCKKTESK